MKELLALLLTVSTAVSAADATINSDKSKETASSVIYETELANSTYKMIDIVPIEQYPELPTGCEVTSLAVVLNYLGYDVDKVTLADEYLTKAPLGYCDFSIAFMGDPKLPTGFGCYSPVLFECAEKYLASVDGKNTVKDITGSSPDTLYEQVFRGNPVIVWATGEMKEPTPAKIWTRSGKVPWLTGEHCLVLVGYDKTNNLVFFADPLKEGITQYDKTLFEQRYAQLGSQAIIIE